MNQQIVLMSFIHMVLIRLSKYIRLAQEIINSIRGLLRDLKYNNIEQQMDDEYLSIKIKDGLFIGNKWTASDLEFLIANRFKYVLNCTSQVKNYFQSSNYIKYYKLKYSKSKPEQLLWKENMKKLKKIVEFINTSEEDAECCLIHSNDGTNRCVAVTIAYLMMRYKWKFQKVIQFFDSKSIQMKLNENYIKQLKQLEETISMESIMTVGWNKDNLEDEELLLTNTYLNSIQIPFKKGNEPPKGTRRIQWKDKIQKQQKLQKEKAKKVLAKQQHKRQKIQKFQKNQKSQKRMVKSQIIQVKKQHVKQSTRDTKEKDKYSNRPSSSFSKSFTKKNKEQKLSQKGKNQEKEQDMDGQDSSTEDRPHNNRLINNFVSIGQQPKRTSKMAPRKSQQNIKMIRAFSQKDYSSFKQTNKSSNIPVNTSKQSLKGIAKTKDNKVQLPTKHYKSMQEGKVRAVSPKQNTRYRN